jgi:dephospho-CoA kinase
MLRIGLTGGIGSGKSTVAALFARHGVPVIDTDEIARLATRPGCPALDEIVRAFGPSMLNAAGELDRAALRRRVFTDPDERRQLEAILHPRIRFEVERQVAALKVPYCVIVVPLLIEVGFSDLADRVLVVDAEEGDQIARTRARSQLTETEVRRIMATQASRADRLKAAHDVIVNNADLAHLEHEVGRLHQRYLSLAAAT